jgi:hypothetical protein
MTTVLIFLCHSGLRAGIFVVLFLEVVGGDPVQPHTYDSQKNMALISSAVVGLSIYISVLTSVGLDGMTWVLESKMTGF